MFCDQLIVAGSRVSGFQICDEDDEDKIDPITAFRMFNAHIRGLGLKPIAWDLGTIQPLYELIRPLIVKASLLVGGIFGIYIILLAFRVYYERRNQILLEHIRYDLDQLNKHQGIPSSQERKSFFHKAIIDKIFPTHAQRKHLIAKPKRP